jgi:hypothetical protein
MMDMNELYARHQVALLDVQYGVSASQRQSAGECADYYAGRIADHHLGLGQTHAAVLSACEGSRQAL